MTWWLVVVTAVVGVGLLVTRPLESTVDPWEDDVARWFAGERTPGLDTLAGAGTFVGNTWVGIALAVLLAVAASWWLRSWRPAAFVAVLMAGVYAVYVVATRLVPRDRPPVRILDPGLVPDRSFPSGHVATSVVVYGAAAVLLAWAVPRSRRWTWVLALLPACVLLARLYQGAHHLTDVLTSVAFATAWLVAVTSVVLPAGPGRRR